MVDADVVARKLAIARQRLQAAQQLLERGGDGGEGLPLDSQRRDLAAFYLFLAIQEAIDLAAHWVSDEDLEVPDHAGAAFAVLADHDAIPRELADAMRRAVGLRNRIAHGYTTLDEQRLEEEIEPGARDLRRFLAAVATAAGL